jgi:hypothetical protein
VVTLDPARGDQLAEGAPVAARGKFVVGCDGANSIVRSLMNTEVTDTGFSSSWLVVDTVPIAGVPFTSLFGHVLDPARPTTLAPAGKERQRFEFMIVEGDDPERIAAEDSVWQLLARWKITPERVTLARRAIYVFRGRWAQTWRDGRVLLAGDAAHQMPPFLGQGFNSGVRDAIALAWRLDLILSNKARADLLDSYTTERLHHVKEIIEHSVAVGRMICITDPEAAEWRNAALRAMRDDPSLSPPQPAWRLGPGCLMADDPAAGFLAQQAQVEKDGRAGLLEDLAGAGRFLLLGDGIDPLVALSRQARAVWATLDGLGLTIGERGYRDLEGAYAAWFERLGAMVVLVRPDFQVFGAAAHAADADRLVMRLGALLNMT